MFYVRAYLEADYEDFVHIDATTQSTAYWGEADWQPVHPPCDNSPDANRYVAVHTESSEVVGYGAVLLAEHANIDVMVHPAWQRRGVGTLLWEQMRQDLYVCGAVMVGPWVRAENVAACDWLGALGFAHVNRDGPVQLSVADVDLSPFAQVTHHLAERGVVMTTLADEMQSTPDYMAKFYDLFQEVEKDVPGYSVANRTSYEQCVRELEQPGMLPESVFLARHDAEYVGLSILGRRVSEDDLRFAGGAGCLSQHLTGVRRAYRRQGIALGLKVCTIRYAEEHGYDRILSNSDNPAMRALNWKLGFRTGPWRVFHLDLPILPGSTQCKAPGIMK